MRKSDKFSDEVRERAVRMVLEHQTEYDSQWAAIESISGKFGCTSETLRRWVRRAERDQGKRPGPTTAEQARIKELEELLLAVPLPRSQRHRMHVLPSKGLPTYRNSLRSPRCQLHGCRLYRRDRQLLVMSLGPSSVSTGIT